MVSVSSGKVDYFLGVGTIPSIENPKEPLNLKSVELCKTPFYLRSAYSTVSGLYIYIETITKAQYEQFKNFKVYICASERIPKCDEWATTLDWKNPKFALFKIFTNDYLRTFFFEGEIEFTMEAKC